MSRQLIRRLDALICRLSEVYEFCAEPGCILRLQMVSLKRPRSLPGLELPAGSPVLLIHLWNERLPLVPPSGPDLAWAKTLQRSFVFSLRLACAYLEQQPLLEDLRAVGGTTSLFGLPGARPGEHAGGGRFLQRLGFTLLPYTPPLGEFAEFWENFYAWLLLWTYNPASLRHRQLLRLSRIELWMTRGDFLRRFSTPVQVSGC